MLLIRTYPHGLTPYEFQFHVYDPDKATLHWFKRKTHALIHMANQNNGVLPSYATLTPDFIVADPDRTRTYRDGIYVFHGKLDLAVTNTLHFVKNTHATLKTVPYSKIEELALKNDVPLIGYPDDVEKDFSVVVSFFEQAVLAKNTRQGMYSTTEVVDLVVRVPPSGGN